MCSLSHLNVVRASSSSLLVLATLAFGCANPPGEQDRSPSDRDVGVDTGSGPSADGGSPDGGETDTGPTGPPGFSLEGSVSSGAGAAQGGGFSLNGRLESTHSGQVCTGDGWRLELSPLQARE